MKETILSIEDLRVSFPAGRKRWVNVVDGITFDIQKSEILGIVGESGCGKSMSAYSIMRLVPSPGKVHAKSLVWQGKDILGLNTSLMRSIRGNEIGMVFQEPMTSLNPLFTVGYQIEEAIRAHTRFSPAQSREKVFAKLHAVQFPYNKQAYHIYPHQLSGGMRQRVMIAIAISCDPELVIADEPTTALDVTVQAQIMDLFKHLVKIETGSLMLISHDLTLVMEVADRVAIMYAGHLVEVASSNEILERPLHPYTDGLLRAVPKKIAGCGKLTGIPGNVPDPFHRPHGCRFHPRCAFKMDQCMEKQTMDSFGNQHYVRCWRAKEWENGLLDQKK